LALLTLALLLAGCHAAPDDYPVPAWRRTPAPGGAGLQYFVEMSDARLDAHVVADIVPEEQPLAARWTLRRPELRFGLPVTEDLRLRVELSIPGIIMEQTGPMTITYFVAGHKLGSARYAKPGDQQFEQAVPPEWLTTAAPVHVRMELDKVWVSPTDRNVRGVQLYRLGFVR
jgi:hypothetical protein